MGATFRHFAGAPSSPEAPHDAIRPRPPRGVARARQFASKNGQVVNREDRLSIGRNHVKVWTMMALTRFGEHANDNPIESRQLGHIGYASHSPACGEITFRVSITTDVQALSSSRFTALCAVIVSRRVA